MNPATVETEIGDTTPVPNAVDSPAQSSDAIISISVEQLESLLRRVTREVVGEVVGEVVRQAVREELQQIKPITPPSIGEDWSHEGPDDPEGDAELLAEALVAIEEYKKHPEQLMSWEDFQLELEAAEARGELPH